MTNGKTPQELLEETHDKVEQIYTALFGVLGTDDKGLCGDFKDQKVAHGELEKSFLSFRRTVIMIFGFIVGGGGLGLSIAELFKLFR